MTKLTIEYLINNFNLDLNEKVGSKTAEILINQVYEDISLYVLENNVYLHTFDDIESELFNDFKKNCYLKLQAEFLMYILREGNLALILPENQQINYEEWSKFAIPDKIKRILYRPLKLIRRTFILR